MCTHHGKWTQLLHHCPLHICVSAEAARVPHGNGVFIPLELIIGCDCDFFASCQLDGLIRIFEEASSDFRPLESKDTTQIDAHNTVSPLRPNGMM